MTSVPNWGGESHAEPMAARCMMPLSTSMTAVRQAWKHAFCTVSLGNALASERRYCTDWGKHRSPVEPQYTAPSLLGRSGATAHQYGGLARSEDQIQIRPVAFSSMPRRPLPSEMGFRSGFVQAKAPQPTLPSNFAIPMATQKDCCAHMVDTEAAKTRATTGGAGSARPDDFAGNVALDTKLNSVNLSEALTSLSGEPTDDGNELEAPHVTSPSEPSHGADQLAVALLGQEDERAKIEGLLRASSKKRLKKQASRYEMAAMVTSAAPTMPADSRGPDVSLCRVTTDSTAELRPSERVVSPSEGGAAAAHSIVNGMADEAQEATEPITKAQSEEAIIMSPSPGEELGWDV